MGDGPLPPQQVLGLSERTEIATVPSVRTSLILAAVAAVLWTALRLLLTRHIHPPQPSFHDEFSYLLGADTFVHGRLTNPPHPLGRFFESPHILIRPTYASKYPPGQAAWLALGTWLFGTPLGGVLLEGALLVFVLCAMFCAWTKAPVAAAMTLISVCWLLPPNYWTTGYWGGSAAAIGAALVLLGVGRYVAGGWPATAGILVALGALQLFFTRPYEGGVLCIATLVSVPYLVHRLRAPGRFRGLFRVAGFAAPVLVAGFAWAACYNKAVTGNVAQFPYILHDRTYNVTPVFWFLPLRPEPAYSNGRLSAQHGSHGWEAQAYREVRASRFPLAYCFGEWIRVLVPAAPLLPIILLSPLAWRDVRCRSLFFVCAACVLSLSLETWHLLHYAAPAIVALFLFCACTIGGISFGARVQRVLVAISVVAALGYFAVRLYARPMLYPLRESFGERRAALIQTLSKLEGHHLVLVRYPDPQACVQNEWVYNGADIDSQRVIFAHDRGPVDNSALLDYFKDRKKWLLTATCSGEQLTPLVGEIVRSDAKPPQSQPQRDRQTFERGWGALADPLPFRPVCIQLSFVAAGPHLPV